MYKAPSMWTYKHKTYWTTRPCQALPSFFAAFSCEASCFCFKTEMAASILDMSKLAELVLDKSDSQPASSSWSMWWSSCMPSSSLYAKIGRGKAGENSDQKIDKNNEQNRICLRSNTDSAKPAISSRIHCKAALLLVLERRARGRNRAASDWIKCILL